MMARLIKLIVPVLILALAIVVFMYMKKTKPEQPPVEISEKVWMIDAMKVEYQSLASVQGLFGTVSSNAMVTASAPLSAEVMTVSVQPGDVIKKGQLLVALHPKDIEIPLLQAQASYEEAKAQLGLQKLANDANQQKLAHEKKVLELKHDQVERTKSLMKRNLASQSVLDGVREAFLRQEYAVVGMEQAVSEAQLRLMQAQANVQKAQAALEQAQLNQQRAQLVAPYDGRVAEVMVSEGDRVSPNAPMLSFYSLDSLELKVKLPIEQLAEVQASLDMGDSQALKALFNERNQSHDLPLLRLAGQAQTSGVEAYFSIPKALSYKRPGELMEVLFQSAPMNDVFALPYSAIYGNDRIYTIEDQRLQAQTVQLVGEVQKQGQLWALVKSTSIPAGAKVMTTHLPNAVTGLKVVEEGA